jgi:hypothetical protein
MLVLRLNHIDKYLSMILFGLFVPSCLLETISTWATYYLARDYDVSPILITSNLLASLYNLSEE